MDFIVDSDGSKIFKEDIFTSVIYKNKIMAAIQKFKMGNYRFYFNNEEDLTQEIYCYIWKKLDKYDNKRASFNTFLYRLIKSSLLLNGYSVNKTKRSGKSMIHEIMTNYKDIWEFIGTSNRKYEEVITTTKKPFFMIEFNELMTNLEKFYRKKKKNTFVKVLGLLIEFDGDKKRIAKHLNLTVIRINQIIKEICKTEIYNDYILSIRGT